MSKKDPETAIVAGASRCTVAAVAELPAGDGFNVVINYAGEHGSAAALVARIQQVGWSAMVHQADVSDAEAGRVRSTRFKVAAPMSCQPQRPRPPRGSSNLRGTKYRLKTARSIPISSVFSPSACTRRL
jgi:hypothetical protein